MKFSVRLAAAAKTPEGKGAAMTGAGAGIVGMAAEWGVEFPGPFTIALVAWIAGVFCRIYLPKLGELWGNGK